MLSTNVLCIKKKKKRSYCFASKTENGPTSTEKTKRSAGGAATMLQITEDTPPDMLAGAMDLTVHLPTGRSVKMSVERSTPMMDLLVQITTNYHLQLSGFTLQALGMAPSKEHSDSILPYKPNTPIGALDTQHIRVVPKPRNMSVPKNVPPGHQPFESTFRLKVHLPRNQLYVTRVSHNVHLDEIMKKVCEEKNLDSRKYEFRHPGNLDEILDPKLTLSDYTITEIYLVQRGSLNQTFSTNDIMALRKEEERKQMHNKTGGGVFNLIFRRGKSSTGSLSSENRSISPTHSDDSRSVTPPGIQQQIITPPSEPADRPKPPQRKRRPAPKPPVDATKKTDTGLTVCHSRNSSDSSGYHEASILSDNCNTSLPRRPKSTMVTDEAQKTIFGQHSQSTSNLSKMSVHSKSTSSLAFPSRKKKTAPPPPPPVLKSEKTETNLEEPSPVVASQPCTVAQTESVASQRVAPRESLNSLPALSVESRESVEEKKTEPIDSKPETDQVKEVEQTASNNTEVKSEDQVDSHKTPELESDWHYQLPSPPKAFRDSSPVAFRDAPQESIADSVVTSPELFEKLKEVKDNQSEKDTVSDLTSVVSEEERPILNKLSLENLEKRKSLVYNRELATSLKMPDDERKETFSSSLMNFEKTFDEVKQSSLKQPSSARTLPNFKITTYNNPKQKLNIFEDDTIRSNTERNNKTNSFAEPTFPLQKNYIGRSMENISFRKNSLGKASDDEINRNGEYKFFKPPPPKTQFNIYRSESFTKEQKWVPSKPVSRSKSQVAINRYPDTKNPMQTGEDSLTKSNSLFDVSGLQSLGVMRQIQNKLNTPNSSMEKLDQEEPSYQKPPETKNEVQNHVEQKPVTVRSYKYSPPSINMGTWSERPKIPVNVKDDPDYKYSVKETTSRLVVNTINNDVKSHNSVEIRNKSNPSYTNNSVSVRVGPETTKKNFSIKVNGFEPVSQTSGNVVIKIGGTPQSNKPVLRKPLGNINSENQRPHSIAFGSDFDISRVPIVRSVEFKKPYKEYQGNTTNNTSITQIVPSNNFVPQRNGYKDSSEPLKYSESTIKPQVEPKPVFRVNSYLQNSSAPIVRGFRNSTSDVNKTSWNQPHSFSTLPSKPPPRNFALNAPVPFSQSNLRRTESTNREKKNGQNGPPPAPVMPKVFHSANTKNGDSFGDPKEQLLQAIRDFGGKKGLRAVKA